MDIEKIITENQGTIVDVRSYGEFLGGNVAGSINIPLNEIPERIEAVKRNIFFRNLVWNAIMAVHGST